MKFIKSLFVIKFENIFRNKPLLGIISKEEYMDNDDFLQDLTFLNDFFFQFIWVFF